jgi:hypothetical protein
MKNITKNPARLGGKQGGFLQIIILIIIALLIMNYFHLTISGVLAYFNTSISEIVDWFKSLFQSVVR